MSVLCMVCKYQSLGSHEQPCDGCGISSKFEPILETKTPNPNKEDRANLEKTPDTEETKSSIKDYIIWLKSGECITGSIEEAAIEELQNAFMRNCNNHVAEFSDTEGKIVLRMNTIEAIAINKKPQDKSPIGLKGGE